MSTVENQPDLSRYVPTNELNSCLIGASKSGKGHGAGAWQQTRYRDVQKFGGSYSYDPQGKGEPPTGGLAQPKFFLPISRKEDSSATHSEGGNRPDIPFFIFCPYISYRSGNLNKFEGEGIAGIKVTRDA
jgi:hypothetical protein